MTDCNEFSLMLGAFEDGELEPHEMQAVAFHLARCENCTGALAEISTLGRDLRGSVTIPQLDGFAAGVMRRVEALPVPLGTRISRALSRLGENISSGFALTAAMGAIAAVTALFVTPYARQILTRQAAPLVAKNDKPLVSAPVEVANSVTPPNQPGSEGDIVPAAASSSGAPLADDSRAEISKLESEVPSVAVWSEPKNDTTVIWLPDQSK